MQQLRTWSEAVFHNQSEEFVTSADAVLVQRCLAGDEGGVRAFVEKFQRRVFGLCYRMLGHREDAEDVSQDVFLRIFRNLHRWDSSRPLMPWMMTIAANRCRTALQQRARVPAPMEFVDSDVSDNPADHSDLAEELQLALETLREEYRVCFVLFHQQELGCAEIGEILDCPEGTVKTWLHRARRELAESLRRRGVAPHEHNEPPELQRV